MKLMIFDIDNWREIGATLSRNKTRTFLTAFGIFWGTAMLTLLWGGSHGLTGMMRSNFDGIATNSAMVFANRTTIPYKGYRKGMKWDLDVNDMNNLKASVPSIESISPMSQRATTYKHGTQSKTGAVQGIESSFIEAIPPIITSGRFINLTDEATERKVAVIGDNVARELFLGTDPIGQFIEIDNIHYRVVGTVQSRTKNINFSGTKTEDAVFIPLSTFRHAYNSGDKVGFMIIVFRQGSKPGDALPAIRRVIRQNHPISPDDDAALAFWDMSEVFEMFGNLFTGINVLLLFVGFSSLLAGIIGVGNIMWIVVKERTKEFGIRRAIGATPGEILRQILSESIILTLVAGMAGICVAVGILALLSGVQFGDNTADFQLRFSEALSVLIIFIVLGGAAGAIPAFKAMSIKPVEAMNDK